MLRLAISIMTCALLLASVSVQAAENLPPIQPDSSTQAAFRNGLADPSAADCAQATSNYESHELGCQTEESVAVHAIVDPSRRK